jgi:hypothetical protein
MVELILNFDFLALKVTHLNLYNAVTAGANIINYGLLAVIYETQSSCE